MSWNIEKPGDRINGPVTITGNTTLTGTATISGDLTVDTNTLKVDAANNRVGVLTASPSYPLHVAGRISYSSAIGEGADTTLSSSGTVLLHGSSSTWTEQRFYTGGTERLRIDSAGASNVIGPLYVQATGSGTLSSVMAYMGAGDTAFKLVARNGTGTTGLSESARFGLEYQPGPGSGNWNSGFRFIRGGGATDGYIVGCTSGLDRLWLDIAGNLGLGVVPTAKFEIGGGTSGQAIKFSNTAGNTVARTMFAIGYSSAATAGYNAIVGATETQYDDSLGLRFYTGANQLRMAIDYSGNVIVGGTTPANATAGRGNVTINGTSAILNFSISNADSGYLYHDGTNLSQVVRTNGYLSFSTNNTERLRIGANGTVGLGVTPSGWGGGSILMLAGSGAVSYTGTTGGMVSNGYYGDQWRFYGNGRFCQYYQNNGDHVFYSSANNTSGAAAALTPVEVAKINSAGRFAVGSAVAPLNAAQIQGVGQATTSVSDSGDGSALFLSDTVNGVNNGGLLLLGAATANGQRPHVGIKSLLNNGDVNGTADLIFVTRTTTAATTLSEKMRLTKDGNLGLGSTAPVSYSNYSTLTVQGVNGGIINLRNSPLTSQFEIALSSSEAYVKTVTNIPLWFGTNNAERLRIKSTGQLRFVPLASDPAGAEAGDVYYNSTTNKLRCYNGSAWNDLF